MAEILARHPACTGDPNDPLRVTFYTQAVQASWSVIEHADDRCAIALHAGGRVVSVDTTTTPALAAFLAEIKGAA